MESVDIDSLMPRNKLSLVRGLEELQRATVAVGLVLLQFLAACAHSESEPSRESSPRASLIEALEPMRLSPGRLTGFLYATPESRLHRAGSDGRLAAAARDIERRASGSEPTTQADLALLRLASGRLPEAVALLDHAAKASRSTEWIVSDLAAARLECFRLTGDAYELVQALSVIDTPTAIAPTPEFLFNRAVILETLGLRLQAVDAWREYLHRDLGSEWNAEATRHLRKLLQPTAAEAWKNDRRLLENLKLPVQRRRELVGRHRQFVRFWLQEELFPAWAKAVTAGNDPEARRLLTLLQANANDLAASSGDPLLKDAAATAAAAKGARLTDLAHGHLRYAEARVAYEKSEIHQARPVMVEARLLLARAGSSLEQWAAFHVAACDYYLRGGNAPVLAQSAALRERAHRAGYAVVEARTDWVDGAILLDLGRTSEALARFRAAAPLFERTGERNYRAWISSLLANGTRQLGDSPAAWKLHLSALTIGSEEGFTLRLPVFLAEASRTAAKGGDYLAGLRFQTEALRLLSDTGDPLDVSEAYWWRSIMYHQAGDDRRAQEDIDIALREGRKVTDPSVRDHDLAGIAVTAGTILRSRNPRAAVASLTHALDLYRLAGFRYLETQIRLERARAQLALHQRAAAREDLTAAIDEYLLERARISSRGERVAYFDQAREVFELSTEMHLDDGQESWAFETVEQGKTLALLEAMASRDKDSAFRAGPTPPAPPSLIARLLPPQVALVEFVVLPSRTQAWVLDAGGVRSFPLRIGAPELERRVASLRTAILRQPDAAARLAKGLSRTLLDPLQAALPKSGNLVIVPDLALHGLPFAALPHPVTGRPLGETVSLVIAPSARSYLQSFAAARRRGTAAVPTALAIGDPAFDRDLFPDLPRLGGAEGEARDLAALYPESALLTGEQATVRSFLAEIGQHDLILFAGHALANSGAPEKSRLLLARAADSTGELTAQQIEHLSITRPSLVILAACRTADGRAWALEGVTSLAQSFLVAGIPAVIATLWDVPDHGARALLRVFFADYARSGDAPAALARARAEIIRQRTYGPEVWAAFQLIGATAPANRREGS